MFLDNSTVQEPTKFRPIKEYSRETVGPSQILGLYHELEDYVQIFVIVMQ